MKSTAPIETVVPSFFFIIYILQYIKLHYNVFFFFFFYCSSWFDYLLIWWAISLFYLKSQHSDQNSLQASQTQVIDNNNKTTTITNAAYNCRFATPKRWLYNPQIKGFFSSHFLLFHQRCLFYFDPDIHYHFSTRVSLQKLSRYPLILLPLI